MLCMDDTIFLDLQCISSKKIRYIVVERICTRLRWLYCRLICILNYRSFTSAAIAASVTDGAAATAEAVVAIVRCV